MTYVRSIPEKNALLSLIDMLLFTTSLVIHSDENLSYKGEKYVKCLAPSFSLNVDQDQENHHVKGKVANDDTKVAPLVCCVPAINCRVIFFARAVRAVSTVACVVRIVNVTSSAHRKEIGRVVAASLPRRRVEHNKVLFLARNSQVFHFVRS